MKMAKFQTLEHLSKLCPDTNFNTESPDMSEKFRTYGNPTIGLIIISGYRIKLIKIKGLVTSQ